MKAKLGGLTILVAILFGAGHLLSMARAASEPISWQRSLVAFFGFGIPMLLLALATFSLWEGNRDLQIRFGWVCVLFGLAALGLFGLIAECVEIVDVRKKPIEIWEGVALFAGFALPMLICGGVGVGIVLQSDNDKKKR